LLTVLADLGAALTPTLDGTWPADKVGFGVIVIGAEAVGKTCRLGTTAGIRARTPRVVGRDGPVKFVAVDELGVCTGWLKCKEKQKRGEERQGSVQPSNRAAAL
jgi:hypothetical protein